MAQGDPRDPFGRDDSGTGAAASQSGVTSAGTLPLTGSTTTPLMGVAVVLLAGGVALWMTGYRPRHGGYRPRHAR